MKPKFTISKDNLLIMKDVYLTDITYLKRCGTLDDDFILKYIILLEDRIDDINNELKLRGE
jgi:hypothetical protein